MIQKPTQGRGNRLLDSLSPGSSAIMFAESEHAQMGEGFVIADPETPVQHVLFPLTCVLSTLSVLPDRTAVETAVTGNEGMSPMAAFHGVESTAEHTIVQVPGEAVRVPLATFQRAVAADPGFSSALHRYSVALFTFASQTSGCNRRHSVVQRCARWLLQTHDRVPGDGFGLTHLFLSQMMGVRRSSVTVAAEALRAAGAIAYTRGTVRVVDRGILASKACVCYAVVRATFDRLLNSGETRSPLAGIRMSAGGRTLVGAPLKERAAALQREAVAM